MIDSIFKDSPLDAVKSRVLIYNQDGLRVAECTCEDILSGFSVSREGVAGKFFGFGVCHKLKMQLININKDPALTFYKGYYAEIYYGDGTSWDRCYPKFYFDEIKVDKKTGDITIIAYDKLKQAADYTYADLEINVTADYPALWSIFYKACGLLGIPKPIYDAENEIHSAMYDILYSPQTPPNYDGTEDVRSVLDDVAEVLRVIYFLDRYENLTWKKVCIDREADLQVTPDMYYEWEEESAKVLSVLYSTNELSDTEGIEVDTAGNVVQYIRENGLLTLREDVQDILATYNSPFRMTPFILDWSGDYTLEIGDCIEIHNNEDDGTTKVYILNDEVDYAGTLSQATSWEWTDNDAENDNSPVNIADKINQTFAKVDKVNKEITLLTTELGGYPEKLAQMQVTVDDITTRVVRVENVTDEEVAALTNRIDTLAKETALKVDAEGVEIIVEETLSEGVEKVVTSAKKYTFDDTGLNISSSDSNISTTITEDGMRIYRGREEVLTADNEGVKAEDLHATTFLIIGTTSRLEDRGNRTACFWIGE